MSERTRRWAFLRQWLDEALELRRQAIVAKLSAAGHKPETS